ncbi:hypothetical protein ACFYT3_06830 [Nocardia amikacinitolerans]|uniref:hypothetical protein n=1 Tax=Nocardia amikacinitolerans TaxID=756689 RepID=UPI0036B8A15C
MDTDLKQRLIAGALVPTVAIILTAVVTKLVQASLVATLIIAAIASAVILFFAVRFRPRRGRVAIQLASLKEVYESRNAASEQDEIDAIHRAKSSVKVLGISHKILWSNQSVFRDALIAASRNRVEVTFLILDPTSDNLTLKARDEGEDPSIWINDINASIARFHDLKAKQPELRLELYTYDEFPIWHMLIIDEKIGYIGYYPTDRSASHAPLYVLERSDEKYSLLVPLMKQFEHLKSTGVRLDLS